MRLILRFEICLLVLLIVSNTTPVMAQNARQEIEKINRAYLGLSHYEMQIDYHLYPNWISEVPLHQERASVQQQGALKRTVMGTLEMIKNRDYSVFVDHEEKSIAILGQKTNLPKMEKQMEQLMAQLTRALEQCEQVKFENINDQQNSYLLIFPQGLSEYQKVKIVYNKNNFLLDEMILYYNQAQSFKDDMPEEKPRLKITLHQMNTKAQFSPEIFTYQPFVNQAGDQLTLKEKYQNYQLMHQPFKP